MKMSKKSLMLMGGGSYNINNIYIYCIVQRDKRRVSKEY